MRKFATLSIALIASLAMAGTASAVMSAAIVGPNTPGTHVYAITLSFDTADNVSGIVGGVVTTGTYTGVFTDASPPGFPTNLGGPAGQLPPTAAGTGIAQYWGHVTGSGAQPGGTYTVGTVEITVSAGQTINPYFGTLAGFVTNTYFSTLAPNGPLTGITIIPEPTTAALLGLGIMGLVLAGRRSRA